jgi:hypothetical protein
MIGTSTLTFLLIEEGSMSTWIFFEPGENAQPAGDAVVERAPMQIMVAIVHRPVGFPGAVHAEHAERADRRPHRRRAPLGSR